MRRLRRLCGGVGWTLFGFGFGGSFGLVERGARACENINQLEGLKLFFYFECIVVSLSICYLVNYRSHIP
jgi:hypothetical protein